MSLSAKKVVVLAVCMIVGFAIISVLYTNGVFKQKTREEKYKPYTYKGIAFTLPETWVKEDSDDYFSYVDRWNDTKDKDKLESIEIQNHI